jgi:hypothetical protein
MLLDRYLHNGSDWKLNENSRVLVLDGSINRQLWDGSSDLWFPQRLVMSEAIDTAGGKAIYSGRFGYWHNPATGETRIFPERGDTTKYIKIAPMTPKSLSIRQVGNKYIELFWEKPDGTERHSLIIYDRGFKTNIRVREGYTGDGLFQWQFEVVGLKQIGRALYVGEKMVCVLPNLFATDRLGKIHEVTENLSNGVLTMGLSIPAQPDWHYDIDPQLGPIQADQDTFLYAGTPTNGWGGYSLSQVGNSGGIERSITRYDINAISPGSVISLATFEAYHVSKQGSPENYNLLLDRCTKEGWEANGGVNTPGAAANWTYHQDTPNVAWATIGGDFDISFQVSAAIPSPGNWITLNPTGLSQDGLDNRSGLVHLFERISNESATSIEARFASLDNATASIRPKLTLIYTPASTVAGNTIIGDRFGGGGLNNVF